MSLKVRAIVSVSFHLRNVTITIVLVGMLAPQIIMALCKIFAYKSLLLRDKLERTTAVVRDRGVGCTSNLGRFVGQNEKNFEGSGQ